MCVVCVVIIADNLTVMVVYPLQIVEGVVMILACFKLFFKIGDVTTQQHKLHVAIGNLVLELQYAVSEWCRTSRAAQGAYTTRASRLCCSTAL